MTAALEQLFIYIHFELWDVVCESLNKGKLTELHSVCLWRSSLPPAASAQQQQVQAVLSGRSRHGVLPDATAVLFLLWPCVQLCGHGERPPSVQDELHSNLQPLLSLR